MTSPCDLLCVNIGTRKPVSIVIMQYIALDPGLHDIVNIVGFCFFFYSDLRQIPDNQEVFAHPVTDQSIIMEILEYVDKDDEEAIRYNYRERNF